jgi:hypothetical protein
MPGAEHQNAEGDKDYAEAQSEMHQAHEDISGS